MNKNIITLSLILVSCGTIGAICPRHGRTEYGNRRCNRTFQNRRGNACGPRDGRGSGPRSGRQIGPQDRRGNGPRNGSGPGCNGK